MDIWSVKNIVLKTDVGGTKLRVHGQHIMGHFNFLQYAHENLCARDMGTTYRVAKEGDLNCLKYAHNNGYPWDEDVTL